MNNNAIHRFKFTKEFFADKKIKAHFNVDYAPELSPI